MINQCHQVDLFPISLQQVDFSTEPISHTNRLELLKPHPRAQSLDIRALGRQCHSTVNKRSVS